MRTTNITATPGRRDSDSYLEVRTTLHHKCEGKIFMEGRCLAVVLPVLFIFSSTGFVLEIFFFCVLLSVLF